MKSQAVNTIVSAVNNHRYRVFPLTVPEIEEIWKIARKALWTTRNLDGLEVTKHKISHDKVVKSLDNGGLALIHPRQAAITSIVLPTCLGEQDKYSQRAGESSQRWLG